MKAYVLPVENACNGSCNFCITRFRKFTQKKMLQPAKLEKIIRDIKIDKIEITGGGEPTLNPNIGDIIKICSKKAPTQMYSNGSFGYFPEIDYLSCLCISRHHYDAGENKRIMGLDYDLSKLEFKVPLKLSLLLLRSGIESLDELENYLKWASRIKSKKVVVRQMFHYENEGYKNILDQEYISAEVINKEIRKNPNFILKEDNLNNCLYYFNNLEVEIELRSCACESNNPVIHSNGLISKGWDDIK
ncbi:MAG: radical SAM protein [Candidatus Woesearchaeota archaeon]